MDIKINKDIAKEYPDDAWKGFSLTQIIYIAVAVISGVAVILLLYFVLGLNIHAAVYGAFPVAAPIAFCGFFQYAGMSLPELVRHRLRLGREQLLYFWAGELQEEAADGTEKAKKEKKQRKGTKKSEREGRLWVS